MLDHYNDLSRVFVKKVGDFLKQGSGSLVKSGLKIPRSYKKEKEDMNLDKIGLIGMGNMGGAILRGLLKLYSPENMVFTDTSREKREAVTAETGVPHTLTNRECAQQAKFLILAVKPQYFESVFEDIRPAVTPHQVIVSLAPGRSIANLTEGLGGNVRVVRVMPNTPALLGEGMTGVTYQPDAYTEEEKEEIKRIFTSCGRMELVEERLMDAVGCVSGCSPAYVYMFIEALADSGVKYGLPRQTAYTMAAQTVLGSARMILETGKHPGQLKDEVCSPGGTTIAGVSALEESGFRSAVIKAGDACYKRTQEMKEMA